MHFHILITLPVSDWAPKIIAELVLNGYEVSAGTTDNSIAHKGTLASVIAIEVKKNEKSDRSKFINFLAQKLNELQISYFSLVVKDKTENNGFTWKSSTTPLDSLPPQKSYKISNLN